MRLIWLVSGHQRCSSGSVLGPVLFSVSVSDPGARTECPISRAADDVKQGGAVDSLEGQESLQRDRVEHWAVINGMKFNKSKCWIRLLGWSIVGTSMSWRSNGWRSALWKGIWECWTAAAPCEPSCAPAAPRANLVLGCIEHSITSQSGEGIIPLPQPHLEHWVQVCS